MHRVEDAKNMVKHRPNGWRIEYTFEFTAKRFKEVFRLILGKSDTIEHTFQLRRLKAEPVLDEIPDFIRGVARAFESLGHVAHAKTQAVF